ncbi:unnamed protein product [Phytomonas sp. EM1]|nr:unnamed protein product [Phytomonas sp. EM1]|eukprot:CCW61402.1 unnamed protein product [Phytomonas sp. isolate EM1]
MSNPLESLFGLFPQLRDRSSDTSINISRNIPFILPLSQLGLSTSGTSVSQGNFHPLSTSNTVSESAAHGHIYSGGMPAPLWIQREQQLTPFHFPSAPTSQNLDDTKLREDGNKAFREGRYTEALNFYTQAIERNPNQELNFSNRSFAHFKLGNYEASAKDAMEAIRINSNFYKSYYRLGLAQVAMGEFAMALESLKKALELTPVNEKQPIIVAIAKCESKLARAPTSSSNGSINLDSLQSPLMIKSAEADGYPCSEPQVDYAHLQNCLASIGESRARVDSYQKMFQEQDDIVNCSSRVQRVKHLMNVATTHKLSELCKHAQEMQEELRNTLNSQDRASYYNAKRNRDETYKNVWETASEVESAIAKLRAIAAEEQAFFRRFGSRKGGSQEVTTTESTDDYFSSKSSSPLTSQHPFPTSTFPSSPQAAGHEAGHFEDLLRRRLTINENVRKVQRCFAATDSAGRAFQQALEKEAAEMKRILPLLEEASSLNLELEEQARHVAHFATRELSASRLEALDQMSAMVQRVKLDEGSFKATLEEGNHLLEEEAQLEKERLMLERQRIQLQAEVEWLKVQDEPENRVLVLQNHIKAVQQRIADIHTRQNEVQKRIFELVQTDHPELVWKSIASSSRILRLIKGSGLWLNVSFSDFQIVSTLSSTVNSKVYHAVRRGDHFALKEIAVDDEKVRRQFQREVNIVASCSHPNIVRVKGVFFDGPFAYILLPYYHRGSLKALLAKKEPIPWGEVQSIFRQLATGLSYLHERGICHADIKPSNILMSDSGSPMISDFGIARDNGPLGETFDITVTNSSSNMQNVLGTMQYMAPEQLLGERRGATSKSDIWALGVTSYEVAAFNAFFHDASVGEPSLPLIPSSGGTVEISARRVGGDEKLADLIMFALTVDVNRRATAYELLAHPYFSSSMSSLYCNGSSATLAKSDERIDAVRSYIHAIRATHSQKTLVSVSRNQMVESLTNIIERFDEEDMMAPIMVVFQGESGIDEGALTTEMLTLYYEQLVKREKALVCSISDEEESSRDPDVGIVTGVTYIPAEDDKNIRTSVFELLGKVLLKSIVENRPLPLQLNLSVLKYFCGASISMLDLEEYDRVLAESLKRLRLLSAEDLEMAELKFSTFTATFLSNHFDGKYIRETAVTTENVRDYVELRVQFDLIERRKRALAAMKKGFYSVHSIEPHLKLLSPSDLVLLLCGVQHVSAQAIVDSLEFHGFDSTSKTPTYLKEFLLETSQNNLRRFLQFCTSSAAMPANNSLRKIKVIKASDPRRLPVGHGCVHQLDLMDYNDKDVLKEKLEIALAHVSDGFHIV